MRLNEKKFKFNLFIFKKQLVFFHRIIIIMFIRLPPTNDNCIGKIQSEEWFHHKMSKIVCEIKLIEEGDFLIRQLQFQHMVIFFF